MLHSAVMTKQEIMTWYGFLLTNFPHLLNDDSNECMINCPGMFKYCKILLILDP